ncbi:MAG: molecular chaperone SurA [Betaproteobacteria bacterium RIFCSPLOWO2_02_67_12]|nr:MAG: molecular chaperone SurA [Betaproteobacteria bacterium RIFCSPLOWO2_02_67_12]
MMHRFAVPFCALALAAQVQAQAPTPTSLMVDRIVAVVNKQVVTASELRERVALAERELRRQRTALPERALLERQVLERLIIDKAQLQLAAEGGIRVDELQLDRAIDRVAESNNMTLAAFRRALEVDGVVLARFREELRQQIAMQRLREREVDERIEVSETEIDLFLEEQTAGRSERADFNIAHILMRLPDQASPERIEQARARAEKVLAEARAGGDFAALAASYSDAGDALQGGQMGWRPSDRLPDMFASALRAMKPGEVSEVLRSPAGFHVVKLIARRGAGADQVLAQTRLRHILVKTSEVVSEADARHRLADLRERVVTGGGDFAALARLHSADASATRGGDLGWVFAGDTVPEFERAMDALKPGEISQPVKTPFGWHLIQVLERRTGAPPAERQRLTARQALRERKSEEAYQEWLRQLRDRTYVEIRLEDK